LNRLFFQSPASRRGRASALSALLLGVLCGIPCCADRSPCYGLTAGDRVDITVVEPYDQNSQYLLTNNVLFGPTPGCGFGFDLSQGLVLHATVAENESDRNCKVAAPTFEPFNGWTWTLSSDPGTPDTVLAGAYSASDGACTGLVALTFYVESGDPLQPSVPGQVPHVVMTRQFDGSAPDTPTCHGCLGNFVVNLHKL